MRSGDQLPTMTLTVDPAAIVVMADILGDPNPIHLDPAAVKAAGLGDRVINQGPANLGYIINMLDAALPGLRIARLESRYLANVRGGDVVTAGGTIVSTSGDDVEIEAWLKVEGEVAVSVVAALSSR